MCGTKDEAATKIDRLIQSMDRLSAALERAQPATFEFHPPADGFSSPHVVTVTAGRHLPFASTFPQDGEPAQG